jgi:small-conductance mechanosensitive channel
MPFGILLLSLLSLPALAAGTPDGALAGSKEGSSILNLDIPRIKSVMDHRLNSLVSHTGTQAPGVENSRLDILRQLYHLSAERYRQMKVLSGTAHTLEVSRHDTVPNTVPGEIAQYRRQVALSEKMVALSRDIIASVKKDIELSKHFYPEGQAPETKFPPDAELQKELILARINLESCSLEHAKEKRYLKTVRHELYRSLLVLIFCGLILMGVRYGVAIRIKSLERKYYFNRATLIFLLFFISVWVLTIFIKDLSNFITGMGVAVAGLLIALQEVLSSFFAWFIIRSSRSYRIGDWITIGGNYGEVVDIGMFTTFLAQIVPFSDDNIKGGTSTGGLLVFANNQIFKNSLTNYTQGYPFIWCSQVFTFTYESDWKTAEAIVADAVDIDEINATAKQARGFLEEMAADYILKIENTRPRIRLATSSRGIDFRLRFLAHPKRRPELMDRINRSILTAVNNTEGVDFAYNTLRVISEASANPNLNIEQKPEDTNRLSEEKNTI